MRFAVNFRETDQRLPISFRSNEQRLQATFKDIQVATIRADVDVYDGSYEVTPTNEVQVLPTKHKELTEDLVVNPIPKQYGLVTYNQNREIIIS